MSLISDKRGSHEPLAEPAKRQDPTAWILECDEPQARWVALSQRPPNAPSSRRASDSEGSRRGPGPSRDARPPRPAAGGLGNARRRFRHNKPELSTNLLDLAADIGVTEADDARIGRLLDNGDAGLLRSRRAVHDACESTHGSARVGVLAVRHARDRGRPGTFRARGQSASAPRALRGGGRPRADRIRPGVAVPPRTATGFRGPGRRRAHVRRRRSKRSGRSRGSRETAGLASGRG